MAAVAAAEELATAPPSTSRTLKAGVLNLWAAMGATDPAQEASFLNSVSSQMTAAVEGTTSMVTVLSSAVAKYNPASLLVQGGLSVGSTIGNTIGGTLGAGVGLLRGASTKAVKLSVVEGAPQDDSAVTSSAVEGR